MTKLSQKSLERHTQHDIIYLEIAKSLSKLSYAKRSKVGCIIVSDDGQIISQGWNGMPQGMDNCCEYKDEDGNLVTNKFVLHAESNAITKCARWGNTIDDATCYVTLSPCIECSKLIVQTGVKRVVYIEEYRNLEGIELLLNCGVKVNWYSEEENKLYDILNVEKYISHESSFTERWITRKKLLIECKELNITCG